ncbi:unnamed protein product [marine sediment metagenome]|uniref:Uncharacterized protein n=1 Tax=marine sediment metagenome TaxID=412755 RepID=X1LK61_9ZZZZ
MDMKFVAIVKDPVGIVLPEAVIILVTMTQTVTTAMIIVI